MTITNILLVNIEQRFKSGVRSSKARTRLNHVLVVLLEGLGILLLIRIMPVSNEQDENEKEKKYIMVSTNLDDLLAQVCLLLLGEMHCSTESLRIFLFQQLSNFFRVRSKERSSLFLPLGNVEFLRNLVLCLFHKRIELCQTLLIYM